MVVNAIAVCFNKMVSYYKYTYINVGNTMIGHPHVGYLPHPKWLLMRDSRSAKLCGTVLAPSLHRLLGEQRFPRGSVPYRNNGAVIVRQQYRISDIRRTRV